MVVPKTPVKNRIYFWTTMNNIHDVRTNTVTATACATLLAMSLYQSILGDDLGDQTATEQGKEGLARMITNRFNLNLNKARG